MKGHRKLLIDQSKTSWRNRWGCIAEMQPHSGDDILLPVHKSLMEYNFIIPLRWRSQHSAHLLPVLSTWWWGQFIRAGTNVWLTWFLCRHLRTTCESVLINTARDTEISIFLKSNHTVLFEKRETESPLSKPELLHLKLSYHGEKELTRYFVFLSRKQRGKKW